MGKTYKDRKKRNHEQIFLGPRRKHPYQKPKYANQDWDYDDDEYESYLSHHELVSEHLRRPLKGLDILENEL
jgi:hypothetical protein